MDSQTAFETLGHGPLEPEACPVCHRPFGFCACHAVVQRIVSWPVTQPDYLTAKTFARFFELNHRALTKRYLRISPDWGRPEDFCDFCRVQFDLYGRAS